MLINKNVIQEEDEEMTSRSKSSQRLPPNKHMKSSPFSKKSSIQESSTSRERPRIDISSRMVKENIGFTPLLPYQFSEGPPATMEKHCENLNQDLSQVSFKAVAPREMSPLLRKQKLSKEHTRSTSKLNKKSPGKDIEELLLIIQAEEAKITKELQLKEQQESFCCSSLLPATALKSDTEMEGIDPQTGKMKRICCKKSQKRLMLSNESMLSVKENQKLQQSFRGLQTQRSKNSPFFAQQLINSSYEGSRNRSSYSNVSNEDQGLIPNRRQPTPQKVYQAFKEQAMDYKMGFPDNENLVPIHLDSLQEKCKKMWNFETEELYNPQCSVTYDVYVDNLSRTLTALISQHTQQPTKINLGNRKPVKKMQIQITSINQNKFKRTKNGHGWGYGPESQKKIAPSLKKLLDRSSPQVRNARFEPNSGTMDRVLEAFVPELQKKSPKPQKFEDQLIMCCRRKQELDEDGCPVEHKLKFNTLNQQSAMWSELGGHSTYLESAMDIERFQSGQNGDDKHSMSSKRVVKHGEGSLGTKRTSKQPQYRDDSSKWHVLLEQSMRKFEHYENNPDSIYRAKLSEGIQSPTSDNSLGEIDENISQDYEERINVMSKKANILDHLSDSDEEIQEAMKLKASGNISPELSPRRKQEIITENSVLKSKSTITSSGKFQKSKQGLRTSVEKTEDIEKIMQNEEQKLSYRQDLVEIKNQWQQLEDRVQRATQSRFDSKFELQRVIMKDEPIEGRKIVNKRRAHLNMLNSITPLSTVGPSSGQTGHRPSIATLGNGNPKRSPFAKKNNTRNQKGAISLQTKKKGGSPLINRPPVNTYELSAPVFPGGPPQPPFKTIQNDRTSVNFMNNTTALSPFTRKPRAQLPQSLPNKNKVINTNSSIESELNGPKSIRLLQNKVLSQSMLEPGSNKKSTRKELPKLKVVNKLGAAQSPSRATILKRTIGKEQVHMKNLSIREIYNSAKRGSGRKGPNRDLSFDISQTLSKMPLESSTHRGAFQFQKEHLTSEQIVGSRLSVGKASSIFQRPTFDQVCDIERARDMHQTYGSSLTGMQEIEQSQDLTTKFGYTGMWEKPNSNNRITQMDQNMVSSGDAFFPHNLSTALVQQKISFGAKEDFQLMKNFDEDSLGSTNNQDNPYDMMMDEMEGQMNQTGRQPFDVTVTSTHNNFKSAQSRFTPYGFETNTLLYPDAPKMIIRDDAPKRNNSSYNPEKVKERIAQIRAKLKKPIAMKDEHSFVNLVDQKHDLCNTTALNKDSTQISTQGLSLPDFISRAFTKHQTSPQEHGYATGYEAREMPQLQTFTDSFADQPRYADEKMKPGYTFRQFEKDGVMNKTNYTLPTLNRYKNYNQ